MRIGALFEWLEVFVLLVVFAIIAAPLLLLYAVAGKALEAEDELTRIMLEERLMEEDTDWW